jgi:cytochrome c oxidase subunit 2
MFFLSPAHAQTFMPPAGTQIAHQVDMLYGFLLIASFISCALVIGGFIYFAYKFQRKADAKHTPSVTHNNVLEFLWSFIPFLIFMLVFVWGWIIYQQMRKMPTEGLEVAVQAQKWSWTFQYKSGKTSSNELYVPVDTDVKFVMTSKDVIHSLFVPAFRYKQDVVPGRYTAMWFHPDKVGDYQIFCTEYCGDGHSAMLATLHVVPRAQFDEWLANDAYKGLALADIGQKVYSSRCMICHQTSDQKLVGPGWKGLFGKQEVMESGETVTADENYIRESILNPNAKIVKGFPPAMPSFAGQLNDQEILGVIEYIKTLK